MSELTPGKEAGDREPGDEVARSELGEVVDPSGHGYWIVRDIGMYVRIYVSIRIGDFPADSRKRIAT